MIDSKNDPNSVRESNDIVGRSGQGSQSLLRFLTADAGVKARSDQPHPEVSLALDRWESIHSQLRQLELTLSEAVRLYAEGRGPVPIQLVSEVTDLRGQCAGYFAGLIAAVKAQPFESDSGDATSGST